MPSTGIVGGDVCGSVSATGSGPRLMPGHDAGMSGPAVNPGVSSLHADERSAHRAVRRNARGLSEGTSTAGRVSIGDTLGGGIGCGIPGIMSDSGRRRMSSPNIDIVWKRGAVAPHPNVHHAGASRTPAETIHMRSAP